LIHIAICTSLTSIELVLVLITLLIDALISTLQSVMSECDSQVDAPTARVDPPAAQAASSSSSDASSTGASKSKPPVDTKCSICPDEKKQLSRFCPAHHCIAESMHRQAIACDQEAWFDNVKVPAKFKAAVEEFAATNPRRKYRKK
jgi:hypothetical protein